MIPELAADNDALRAKFRALRTREDVSDLLEVPDSVLIYWLYRKGDSNRYDDFAIRKRSGGTRQIGAPIGSFKLIQSKLARVLSLVARPRDCVHGFVSDRSILTNARPHLRRATILNIDIQDFFPSINFGRVRGMFMAAPYRVGIEAATVLAQICCRNNELPQGAPTSPVVSNMICSRLDTQMLKFAKGKGLLYSRYADDLTLSSYRTREPALGTNDLSTKPFKAIVPTGIIAIVESNGFRLNAEKARITGKNVRQRIAGIIVNKKMNLERSYYRQVRSMLHSWEKYGFELASQEHFGRYSTKNYQPPDREPDFANIIFGKINYLRMVRGQKDPLYRKLNNRHATLSGQPGRILPVTTEERAGASVWVVEAEDRQGTCFYLDGIGLLTCNHVLRNAITVEIFRSSDPIGTRLIAVVTARDEQWDLAILQAAISRPIDPLAKGSFDELEPRPSVTLCGFPHHRYGDSPSITSARIVGSRTIEGVRYHVIDRAIVQGHSGGPVLDDSCRVIGIAARGAEEFAGAINETFYGVIPIEALDRLNWA